MTTRLKPNAVAAAIALLNIPLWAADANAEVLAPWLVQMGASETVLSAANWGKDQWLGVVDTGIKSSHQAFAAGQVSASLSSCAALTFSCQSGGTDDHGHGTAVAAIAAGNFRAPAAVSSGRYSVAANSVLGMASNANLIAEKVLNASARGYSVDVANGLRKAVDAGASVVNLSLSFVNSGDLISAINYAAGKGVYIVWSGGNSAQTLVGGSDIAGLSTAALSRLVLVGSVNAGNGLSSFSNRPGTGGFVNTGMLKTGYASRWVMAPGEGILAPSIGGGATAWGSWTGTSMSAPLVAGSLVLLNSAWPILKTRGTSARLLLATATDLGSAGVDATYGSGLVNLAKAFQPYGVLTVRKLDGRNVAVSSLTTSMLSGGAFGDIGALQATLANYKAFDSYERNFSVDLSGLIKTPATAASLNPLPTNANSGPTVVKLADGAEFGYMPAPSANPAARLGIFDENPELPRDRRHGYAMLADRQGNATAIGHGFPVQYAHARALFGRHDEARLASQLGAASLARMAEGGGLLVHGMKIADDTRLAFSWSGTADLPAGPAAAWRPAWSQAQANNLAVGLSRRLDADLVAGIHLGWLDERHGMLGSTYDATSLLSLGEVNRSVSVGWTASVDLGDRRRLMFEAGYAATVDGRANGLLAGTRDVRSRAWAVGYQQLDATTSGDRFGMSLIQPLRVVSGEAALLTVDVDADGLPAYGRRWISLVPSGREIDLRLAYELPLRRQANLNLQLVARRDVGHIAGNRDASIGVAWQRRF